MTYQNGRIYLNKHSYKKGVETSNYLKIKNELPHHVKLLAVSKGFNSTFIRELNDLGQNDFGESKFQEAREKQINLRVFKDINWHFIGRIQTNKIRKIVENFDYIHSVDSYQKLLKISETAMQLNKIPNIMIQVKLSEDPQKGGMNFDQLIQEWEKIVKTRNIKINGLMTINPKGLTIKENFNLFKKCRSLADSLKLKDCSMGMSADWKEAIDAGSTCIRLGSLIFGERNF